MWTLVVALYKVKLLSPAGMYRFIAAIYKYGINLMMLLQVAGRMHSDKVALVDENETLSYKELAVRSEKLALILKQTYQLESGQKVGFLCRNHASLVQSIFAVSALGADVYLLNMEMKSRAFNHLLDEHDFDVIIHDSESSALLEQSGYQKTRILSYDNHLPAINNLLYTEVGENIKLPRTSSSKIMLLTGGTTGKSRKVAHQPSLLNYLDPFLALLTRLKLMDYKTAYIATPIYHGYGIAVLLLFIALGKKVLIATGFHADKACRLIREHDVEVVTVVPLMIDKILKNNVEDLKSLACIASGSAALNPKLVQQVSAELGDVLYNLYGTSETGLNTIATPQDLTYSAKTIGRNIKGVRVKVPEGVGSIGQFCVKNKWTGSWIPTGDVGYEDENGYYFLCGRTDDMVVSAGENVYPIELEQVLIHHPEIADVAVVGISDEQFGQRLQAFVHPVKHAGITKEELLEWLRPRVARFQMPKEIVFVEQLPYTHLGKIDKKRLK